MTDKIILKPINELLGEHFYIPNYQRGYRWTSQQVDDLLNDIWAFAIKPKGKDNEFYCLQPIVVKEWSELNQKGWEVVDGQQRLTTIYIIINYLAREFLKVDSLTEDYGKEIYTLHYQTRPNSEAFLKNIIADKSNIDFYYISSTYQRIKEWFTNGKNTKDRTDKNKFLNTLLGKKEDERSVQIIWYMAEAQVDSVELFTRLNIGKIPLTNAELIKALFLSSSSFNEESHEDAFRKKIEISKLWDAIELKLSDEHFWAFMTNLKQRDFSTKIELLFDMIADKQQNKIDPLFTFMHFLNRSKEAKQTLWELWLSIEQYYLTICEWYKDKNLYHKIGFLITVGENIKDLITLSIIEKKSSFEAAIDLKIKQNINFEIESLSYENSSDYRKIIKILLLFNVESIRNNHSISEHYPFKFYKNNHWSLEHIHAQNAESLDKTKKEPWIKWLNYHKTLLEDLVSEENSHENFVGLKQLLSEIKELNLEKITWEKFNSLSSAIIEKFTEGSDNYSDELHSISNLALLSHDDNAVLNNSVFEVKRREIIKMDKQGSYIPICTRRVFLKYYNDKPSNQQYYFWSKEDRINYLNEIKTVLKDYLP